MSQLSFVKNIKLDFEYYLDQNDKEVLEKLNLGFEFKNVKHELSRVTNFEVSKELTVNHLHTVLEVLTELEYRLTFNHNTLIISDKD